MSIAVADVPSWRALERSKPTARSRECIATNAQRTIAPRPAASPRSRFVTARTSPNSSPWIPGGDAGESASSAPSPNRVVTTTATAVSRPISGTRPTSAIASAAAASPTPPPTSSGTPVSAATTRPGKSP